MLRVAFIHLLTSHHSCLLAHQSLDDVRLLLLAEIEKLKAGDFSDDLLPSVKNNLKLNYYNSLESNQQRASMFVDAFINGTPWGQEVKSISRIENMTKEQIVDFAKRHFNDNYVAVYKRKGVDETQKKIDKPQITPIPTNRDLVSDFVKEIQESEVKPIEPRFVDFKKDLTFGSVKAKEGDSELPYVYVENKENGRFTLAFKYDFGEESDVRYNYAAEYIDYLGTDSLSAAELKQLFYKLACSYSISVGSRSINVVLNGLSESMPEALKQLENLLLCARVDSAAYMQYVMMLDKARQARSENQLPVSVRLRYVWYL